VVLEVIEFKFIDSFKRVTGFIEIHSSDEKVVKSYSERKARKEG